MKKRPIVVIADAHIEGAMVEYLSELLEQTEVLSPDRATPQAIEEAKAEAVAYVARIHPVGGAELAGMPKLRMISAWGVGYNHIDVSSFQNPFPSFAFYSKSRRRGSCYPTF